MGNKSIMAIIGFTLVSAAIGYTMFNSMIPTNRSFPVLGVPENTYLVAKHDSQNGYIFASKGTTSGKKSLGSMHIMPEIHVVRGQLGSMHMINEDAGSKHNLNIDEFNVHTKDLNYFEAQTVTFVADKEGSFRYYCTIHPEMNGRLIVQ